MQYKVTQTIEARTQPNGNKSGVFYKFGDTFDSSTTSQDGWVKVADKQWIPLASCVTVTVEPPPVEPVGEVLRQTRLSSDGGKTWSQWQTWKLKP
jgi:hypothetical protein